MNIKKRFFFARQILENNYLLNYQKTYVDLEMFFPISLFVIGIWQILVSILMCLFLPIFVFLVEDEGGKK